MITQSSVTEADDLDRQPLVGNVLVVEDEEVVRAFVRKLLEHGGHQVTTADSLRSARNLLARQLDVAVLDVDLPDGNGFELVELLRERSDQLVPIVMITGDPNDEALAKGNTAGITEFLFKPFRGVELTEAVDRALEARARWQRRVEAVSGRELSDEAILEAFASQDFIPKSEIESLSEKLGREYRLTGREQQTLEHMLAGLQNAGIAQALKISGNTVKYHVRNVLTKLGMESRTALFRSLVNRTSSGPSASRTEKPDEED